MPVHSSAQANPPDYELSEAVFPPEIGLLVVGHGTANPIGAAETAEVWALINAACPTTPVELAYLEIIEPSIDKAVERLAAQGCRNIVALPILLFAAGHAKRDVPAALTEAVTRRGLAVQQAAPLGLHKQIVALARRRFLEALAEVTPYSADEEAILIVGRGSSDPTAARQLMTFVEAVFDPVERARGRQRSIGFVAAAQPCLGDAIAATANPPAGRPSPRRVVVHPHLLFPGHVETHVTTQLQRARQVWPDIEWVQVCRLGPAPEVAHAIIDRGLELLKLEGKQRVHGPGGAGRLK